MQQTTSFDVIIDVDRQKSSSTIYGGKQSDYMSCIIIIIIIVTLLFENSSSEVQQTKPFGVAINGDSQKSELPNIYSEKAISNKYVYEGGYNFRRFNCKRQVILDHWGICSKSRFANIVFSFRKKRLVGNG